MTSLLLLARARLDKAHVALAYLLVVLVAAADGGRRVGMAAAALAFVAFNWFFLRPYGTLDIADPFDWFVLLAFLVTSLVASHLFDRVQQEARDARLRAQEVSALAATGAEAMRAPRAAGALQALAEGICRTLGVSGCSICVVGDDAEPAALQLVGRSGTLSQGVPDAARQVVETTTGLAVLPDRVSRILPAVLAERVHPLDGVAVSMLVVPVAARGRTIGALVLGNDTPLVITPDMRRVLGALLYYVALGADRWRLERTSEHVEALREADRLRNAVVASVSHDLRTPLTTISALAHDLGELGDERTEIIAQEAIRLNRFVQDLLDVSRLSAGAMPVRPEVVPVDELVSAALQQVEGAFGGHQVRVALGAGEALLLGRFDPVQSVRILVNLLENAHKYAPRDHAIDLDVRRKGAFVELSVGDRGPGVPPAEAARVFEPLYRPANARPDAGSAGLGLAIARGLAEAQGGSLSYAPREGGGSTFTLRLPAADDPGSAS